MKFSCKKAGEFMYSLAKKLFPINRSITGPGALKTLNIIKSHLNSLEIKKIKSGEKVFDWVIPKEWTIKKAHIIDPNGNKILDFDNNNLHVVGYSTPVNMEISLEKLQKHLHSIPAQPQAIPYVTSYYKENWGFCMTHNQRSKLKKGKYKILIDSKIENGYLNYGELILKGKKKEEVFLSSYICHPSMANNELSGPILLCALALWLEAQKEREYTYRIIFIPETIGSIAYLSKNLKQMKKKIIAGFNLTCVGDNRNYSMIHSRLNDTLADKVLLHCLKHYAKNFKEFSFLKRGSDERQYCSPGVDLPVVVFCRTKFGEYEEYHTSLDNLDLISKEGFEGSFNIMCKVLESIEINKKYINLILCEPQLGKRGLYPSVSKKDIYNELFIQSNLLAYSDGRSLLEISEIIGVSILEIKETVLQLEKAGLIKKI